MEGSNHCNGLFRLGKKRTRPTPEERLEKRKEEAEPLVSAYFAWFQELEPSILPKSLLGKAFTYAKNQEVNLRNYLKDGRLELSNNRSERAIKPFVIGRKKLSLCKHACRRDFQHNYLQHRGNSKGKRLESFPNLDQNGLTMEDMLLLSDSLPDKGRSKNIKK